MSAEQASQDSPESSPSAQAGAASPLRVPLGEWRGPIFWMACGALLAGSLVGAVALVQRVSVERDMMAVAATLPPAGAARAVPVAPDVAGSMPAPAIEQPAAVRPHHARPSGTKPRHPAKHTSKSRSRIQQKPAVGREQYPEVFRRCPPLGEPGAVECRHHICNGAERSGPACKPYRGKLP